MGLFSGMADKYLAKQRLKVVERELALIERCIKFANVTEEGWALIKNLRDERAKLREKLFPPIYI